MTDPSPIDQAPEGLDRRTMLKRSAIVGGALVWTTPVVQSLAGPAFAQETSPVTQGCISGSISDVYFFKIDSAAGALATTPGPCPPDGYTGDEKTTLPPGVSGSFSGTTATITLPAGFTLIDTDIKVGLGPQGPNNEDQNDVDVDENGCVDDGQISVSSAVLNADGSTTYTITVGSTDDINRDISHVNVLFSGCPPLG